MLSKKLLVFLVLTAFMLLVTLKLRYSVDHPRWVASAVFDFVPTEPENLSDCDKLFGPATAASAFQLSPEFHADIAAFAAAANESTTYGNYEGTSFTLATQFKAMHYLSLIHI